MQLMQSLQEDVGKLRKEKEYESKLQLQMIQIRYNLVLLNRFFQCSLYQQIQINFMGLLASTGDQFNVSNASSLNKFKKLHYFSIKQYNVPTQVSDHHEIQMIVSNSQKYQLIRLSYSENGMLIQPLPLSKRFYKYCKRQRCFQIFYSQKGSYQIICSIVRKYARKQFSIVFGWHCQAFCQQVQKSLFTKSNRVYKQIWDVYEKI